MSRLPHASSTPRDIAAAVISRHHKSGLPIRIEEPQWALYHRLVNVSVCVKTSKGTQGSGVVISPSGLVLTAWHNLERSGTPRIHRLRLDRKTKRLIVNKSHRTVDVVFVDKKADIAVLLMRRPPKQMPYADLGDSSELENGSALYRVGLDEVGPLASGYLLKWGTYKRIEELEVGIPGMPGASGGGLFDQNGRLVGIVLRAVYGSVDPSCCFALPLQAIQRRIFRRKAVKVHLPPEEE